MAEGRGLRKAGIAAALLVAAMLVIGILVRSVGGSGPAPAVGETVPTVSVIRPKRDAEGAARSLPGRLQALNSAAIYARTTGYIRRWTVDIGDSVRAGQVLAVIDSPELDQQLAAARADYQTAIANRELARTTARRWAGLLAKDAVSRQEADEKQGGYAAATAVANAARANVSRISALQGFTRLAAPFAGVVTTRSTQIGALVVAGNAAAVPLFTIADVHRIRVYVRVPQVSSGGIVVGTPATLTLPEYPDRSFAARVTRTAGALEAQSGTMLVELQVANEGRALKPGSYADVTFAGAAQRRSPSVPPSALLFGGGGVRVALVTADDRVTMRTVRLGQDNGSTVEVIAGLRGDERVIDNPPEAIADGDRVRVAAAGPQG